ncbi:bifunctional alpha,alpha-trehalose-phosphate synthase (UDP-forming)/trehalose-phosphatase [Mucilaginibacter panaciglaebae]|uniref:Bifunctional alpha,alpha-trehalose-phosphate synthase (UDP-forming)/trehalose-phosphatase n=1 Tax=Mucilaginibacter panaciglaebae TaxID=502331 RepID=A0ABP7WZZ6_9SPHI
MNAYLAHDGRDRFRQRLWVGVPGCDEAAWQHAVSTADTDFNYLPVFTNAETYEHYYDGFSNSLLWPLFHYFPSYAEFHKTDFAAYMDVNRQFARRLLAEVRPGDVIWIHDYHLLPLAAMLRRQSPDLSIELFLHIPFPVFEVFRLVPKPWQRELLLGMLGADVIGFHTDSYQRYFLQAAEQVLQTVPVDGELTWEGRAVSTGVFPVSIDFDMFHDAGLKNDVQELTTHYQSLKHNKKMLFSVDRLDYTKGVHHRIKGYKKFLLQHPEYCGQVVFVLVIVPSRNHIRTYAERKRMIDEYIGDINSSLGTIDWKPVIYQYQHLEFNELAALYRACDVALITPLRDGMNLVAKEFVASRNDGTGVLILSELAGAATELNGALLINPNDADEIASTIKLAIEMGSSEQQERLNAMQIQIKTHDVNRWAANMLQRLEEVTVRRITNAARHIDPFSRASLLAYYTAASERLLLLDYDGTLSPFTARPEQALPSPELLMLLTQLGKHTNTDVYIVSGRDSASLENWLGHLPIGLVAEHGAKVKKIGHDWSVIADDLKAFWPQVEKLMAAYVSKCPGSFMEEKEFSRAWHYRETEPFHGGVKAAELYRELLDCIGPLPLQVLNGHKVIEVRSRLVDKGKAVTGLLKGAKYDFILCVGDDETDEDMFRATAGIRGAFTIKIGEQPSLATYRLHTPYQVHTLLENIINSPEPRRSAR